MLDPTKTLKLTAAALVLFGLSSSASAADKKEKEQTPAGTPARWRAPDDLPARDPFLGPGGAEMRPDLRRITFVKEETGGYEGERAESFEKEEERRREREKESAERLREEEKKIAERRHEDEKKMAERRDEEKGEKPRARLVGTITGGRRPYWPSVTAGASRPKEK